MHACMLAAAAGRRGGGRPLRRIERTPLNASSSREGRTVIHQRLAVGPGHGIQQHLRVAAAALPEIKHRPRGRRLGQRPGALPVACGDWLVGMHPTRQAHWRCCRPANRAPTAAAKQQRTRRGPSPLEPARSRLRSSSQRAGRSDPTAPLSRPTSCSRPLRRWQRQERRRQAAPPVQGARRRPPQQQRGSAHAMGRQEPSLGACTGPGCAQDGLCKLQSCLTQLCPDSPHTHLPHSGLRAGQSFGLSYPRSGGCRAVVLARVTTAFGGGGPCLSPAAAARGSSHTAAGPPAAAG